MATLEPIRTIRYIIATVDAHFLYDLWNGKPSYSTAANHALQTGYAWLDLDAAMRKLKEAREVTSDKLTLALVELERRDGQWHPTNQKVVDP